MLPEVVEGTLWSPDPFFELLSEFVVEVPDTSPWPLSLPEFPESSETGSEVVDFVAESSATGFADATTGWTVHLGFRDIWV
jgi:hypothetical protein